MSSKKLFKIIAIIAATLLLLSVLLSALFVHLYQDEIKAYSITQINKQLDAKVEVKNISLSLWSQFPRASLHFEAVKIITQNAEKTKNYEAISANSIYLSFNIWDLIDHNYKLQQVILKGARLNLLIEENGSHNMHFIKETNSDSSQFFLNLNLVRFKNSKFHYINHATHQELEIDIENLKLGGIFQNELFDVDIETQANILYFKTFDHNMVTNNSFDLSTRLSINLQHQSYELSKAHIVFQGIDLDLDGQFKMLEQGIAIKANLNAAKQRIEDIIDHIPSENRSLFEKYNPTGWISLKVNIDGELAPKKTPLFQIDASVSQLAGQWPQSDLKIKNTQFKLSYTNGKEHNILTSTLEITQLQSKNDFGNIQGSIHVSQLLKPHIKYTLNGQLDLEQLQNLLKLDTLEEASGKLSLQSSGVIQLVNDSTTQTFKIESFEGQHPFELLQGHIKFKGAQWAFKQVYIKGQLLNNQLQLSDLRFESPKGKWTGNIEVFNLPFTQNSNPDKLIVQGSLDITASDLDEILMAFPSSTSSGDSRFPNQLSVSLGLKIKTFSLLQLQAENISTQLQFSNQKLSLQSLKCQVMKGSIAGDFIIDGSVNQRFQLIASGNLQNIDVSTVFKQFNNFDQQIIKSDNIKGLLTSDFALKCDFDAQWNFLSPTLLLDANMQMSQGELINVQSLNALKSYTKIKDFSHIRFSKLQNTISIANSIIKIPQMEIKSDVMNIQLQGTHNFENAYEYHFVVLLSEVLGRKYEKSLETEYGELVNDPSGLTKLFLHLKGKGDQFEVSLDRIGFKQKIASDFKQEKSSLKEALAKEFNGAKVEQDSIQKEVKKQKNLEKEQLKKQEEGQFILQWEE